MVIDSPQGLCWAAQVGDVVREGCGRQSIPVHDPAGVFESTVQKRTLDPGAVSVKIVIDGATVQENSTSGGFGSATVLHWP